MSVSIVVLSVYLGLEQTVTVSVFGAAMGAWDIRWRLALVRPKGLV